MLKIFMFESQLMQMPCPRDIVIYRPRLRAFSIVQKPWGWAHISVQKPRVPGGRGMVTGQIDTCITLITKTQFMKVYDNCFFYWKAEDVLIRSMSHMMTYLIEITLNMLELCDIPRMRYNHLLMGCKVILWNKSIKSL